MSKAANNLESLMSNKEIHIALIGCGAWGKYILRDLKKLGCYVTVYLKELSKSKSKAGLADVITDDINDVANVDGYVIATPTITHATMVKTFAEFKKPIFVEKPLTCSIKEAREVAQSVNKEQVFVMDKWRYHEGILTLAKIAKEQELGKLMSIKSRRIDWGNPHPDVDGAWILLPHDISIIQEIAKETPSPMSAIATEWGKEVVSLCALLKTSSNISCQIEISTCSSINRREIIIECERGIAMLGGGWDSEIVVCQRQAHDRTADEAKKIKVFDNQLPLERELLAFIDYVRGKGPAPKSSLKDAIENVALIDELRKLAKVKHDGILEAF
jgi:predicted dehydrogenase